MDIEHMIATSSQWSFGQSTAEINSMGLWENNMVREGSQLLNYVKFF